LICSGSSESNPSAWHFASDAPTVANTTASNGQQPAIGLEFLNFQLLLQLIFRNCFEAFVS
jgi:hypothetical protein